MKRNTIMTGTLVALCLSCILPSICLAYMAPISLVGPKQPLVSRCTYSYATRTSLTTSTTTTPGSRTSISSLKLYPSIPQKGEKLTSLKAAAASSENIDDDGDVVSDVEVLSQDGQVVLLSTEKKSWFRKIFPKKEDDGLTTKQRLAKMGLATLLSYGFVSNLSSVMLTLLSWYTFNKRTGLSPLAPGQWKGFTAIYAGFYIINNFLRPFRIAGSIAISKYFDMLINAIQKRTNFPRGVCIGLVVFFSNFIVVSALFVSGIALASTLSGVPIFPPKV